MNEVVLHLSPLFIFPVEHPLKYIIYNKPVLYCRYRYSTNECNSNCRILHSATRATRQFYHYFFYTNFINILQKTKFKISILTYVQSRFFFTKIIINIPSKAFLLLLVVNWPRHSYKRYKIG